MDVYGPCAGGVLKRKRSGVYGTKNEGKKEAQT